MCPHVNSHPEVLSSILALALLTTSCSFHDAQVIELDHSGGKIDLGAQLQENWDRVCFLMPYSTSKQAKELLGFSYSPELHSAIAYMDDRTLLVTILGDEVVGSFEVMRKTADFTQFGPGCYQHSRAVFNYELKEGGWNEISAT